MIPSAGCDPRINVVRIGAHLLNMLNSGPADLRNLLEQCSADFGVSVDHVILSLDWLYMIAAIEVNAGEITRK
jgi:hypothetical protein